MEDRVKEENGPGPAFVRFLRKPGVTYTLTGLMLLGALLVMFPPKGLLFKIGVDHAIRVMFAYLVAGFIFLFLGQRRLLFISFLCCALLSYYLKDRTGAGLLPQPEPDLNAPTLRVTHFSTDNISTDSESALQLIRNTTSDLISVQAVTPVWEKWLDAHFGESHPYSYTLPGVDLFGQAVYSRLPFTEIDTVHHNGVPVLHGQVSVLEKEVRFVVVQTYPAVSQGDFERTRLQLSDMINCLAQDDLPLIVLGDLQLVPWSNEVLAFRERLNLRDSRRGLLSAYPYGSVNLLDIPFDYIFYSPEFVCVYFATINTAKVNHVGITGTYQLKYARESAREVQ